MYGSGTICTYSIRMSPDGHYTHLMWRRDTVHVLFDRAAGLVFEIERKGTGFFGNMLSGFVVGIERLGKRRMWS